LATRNTFARSVKSPAQARVLSAEVLEDADAVGVQIAEMQHRHVRQAFEQPAWFVPSFWEDLVESKGLHGTWPDDLALDDAPALVRALAARGLWLEQEALVVDPRTPAALEAML
jgi:hypothetical protein